MKNKVATVATAAFVTSAFAATTAFADTYTVEQGDTLTQIAKEFNTTVTNLKQWNGLQSDRIYVNQTLSISQPTSEEVNSTTVKASGTISSAQNYTVVAGDTLLKIANKHEISLAELVTWNNLNSHLIYPGQDLKVSGSGSVTASSTPTAAPQQDQKNVSVYTIKSGDTLSKIAAQFSTTVSQLKALNNLTSDRIYAGKTLKVSGQPVSESVKQSEQTQANAPTTASAEYH